MYLLYINYCICGVFDYKEKASESILKRFDLFVDFTGKKTVKFEKLVFELKAITFNKL